MLRWRNLQATTWNEGLVRVSGQLKFRSFGMFWRHASVRTHVRSQVLGVECLAVAVGLPAVSASVVYDMTRVLHSPSSGLASRKGRRGLTVEQNPRPFLFFAEALSMLCKALDWLATALPAARNAGGAKGGKPLPQTKSKCQLRIVAKAGCAALSAGGCNSTAVVVPDRV